MSCHVTILNHVTTCTWLLIVVTTVTRLLFVNSMFECSISWNSIFFDTKEKVKSMTPNFESHLIHNGVGNNAFPKQFLSSLRGDPSINIITVRGGALNFTYFGEGHKINNCIIVRKPRWFLDYIPVPDSRRSFSNYRVTKKLTICRYFFDLNILPYRWIIIVP